MSNDELITSALRRFGNLSTLRATGPWRDLALEYASTAGIQ